MSKWNPVAVAAALTLTGSVFVSSQTSGRPANSSLPPLDLPLMEPAPKHGTFYSVQLTNQPPVPICPFEGIAVYLLSSNGPGQAIYAFDDRQIDYAAIAAEREALRKLRAAAMALE